MWITYVAGFHGGGEVPFYEGGIHEALWIADQLQGIVVLAS